MSDTDEWDTVLPFQDHTHNSAKIIIGEKCNEKGQDIFARKTFPQRLEATIATCLEMKKSALWVEVPMCRSGLIEQMASLGFKFHHVDDDGMSSHLFLWLKNDIECKIPAFATHQVGVGAIVVNSRNEILCVRELRNNYVPWKIPGGLTELGEQLDEAAIREVREETGIECRFKSVLSVRHTHGLQFGRSDLYFICRLEPLEVNDKETGRAIIPEPVPEEGEIECAAWVPMKEYKDMVYAPDGHPMMKHIMKLYDQSLDISRTVLSSVVPGRKPSPVYHAPLSNHTVRNASDTAGSQEKSRGRDLQELLANMNPILDDNVYVFATTNEPQKFSDLPAIMRFKEEEGETLILTKDLADKEVGFVHSEPYARITLSVHSALDAVGFLATVCGELAGAGISTNAAAAYYHDHIFVPLSKANHAMKILEKLSQSVKEC